MGLRIEVDVGNGIIACGRVEESARQNERRAPLKPD